MVRLTKHIVGLTTVSALCAIGAVIFAGLQWEASEESGRQVDRQLVMSEHQVENSRLAAQSARDWTLALRDQLKVARDDYEIARKRAMTEEAAASRSMEDVSLALQVNTEINAGDKVGAQITVFNNSSATIVIRRVAILPGFGPSPPTIFQGLAAELRHYPSEHIQLHPHGFWWSAQMLNQVVTAAQSAEFDAAKSTPVAIAGVEFADGAGRIHHRYACEYTVPKPTDDDEHMLVACPSPADD